MPIAALPKISKYLRNRNKNYVQSYKNDYTNDNDVTGCLLHDRNCS